MQNSLPARTSQHVSEAHLDRHTRDYLQRLVDHKIVVSSSFPQAPDDLHFFKTSFFDSLLLICTSFVLRARAFCVLYLLFEDHCKQCSVTRFRDDAEDNS